MGLCHSIPSKISVWEGCPPSLLPVFRLWDQLPLAAQAKAKWIMTGEAVYDGTLCFCPRVHIPPGSQAQRLIFWQKPLPAPTRREQRALSPCSDVLGHCPSCSLTYCTSVPSWVESLPCLSVGIGVSTNRKKSKVPKASFFLKIRKINFGDFDSWLHQSSFPGLHQLSTEHKMSSEFL